MKDKQDNKIQFKEISKNNINNNFVTENNSKISENDIIKNDNESTNIYFIFTIDKNIFDKKELDFSLSIKAPQNTNLIKYDEIEKLVNQKKIKIINQLYNISFKPPKTNSDKINTRLCVQLTNQSGWYQSQNIYIPKKEYFFLYEHSLEELNPNYFKFYYSLNVFQNKLDLQQKFSYFLRRLNPEKWENKQLSISFIRDTFDEIRKKEQMKYNLIFSLLEMSYEKTNLFYFILEEFYNKQKKVYFPKSLNVAKFKPFIELITKEKDLHLDFDNTNKEIQKYMKDSNKISLYLQVFKETFYRKYDKDNYKLLSQDSKFLEIIKNQILSRIITKDEMIDENILNRVLDISTKINEINAILRLGNDLSTILYLIICNFEHLKDIFIKTKQNIRLTEISLKFEENNLLSIKELHKIILELELKHNFFFINFQELIEQYSNHFDLYDLNNLQIIREMIFNQKQYKEELKGMEHKINNLIHRTGIFLAKNLNSKDIINFIINIDKINYNAKDLDIINEINIYEIDEEDFIKFNEIWNKINKEFQKNAVLLIFKKILCLKDIGLIFKLVPFDIFNADTAQLLEIKFKHLFFSFNQNIFPNIIKDISKILLVFHMKLYNPMGFLDFIENNLPQSILNSLYLDIINNRNNIELSKNDSIKKRIINFFTQQNNFDDIQSIIYILENIKESKNKIFINDFFISLNKFIIVKEDFFENELNNKFKLYKSIQNTFNKNYKNYTNYYYFIKCNEVLIELNQKIKNLDFSYKEVKLIEEQINQNYFQEKLNIINSEKQNINNFLKEGILKIEKCYNDLLMAQSFYSLFFESKKEIIIDLQNKITIFEESTNINHLNTVETLFNIEPNYKFARKYQKLLNSKFFIDIFNKYKEKYAEENEEKIFSKCINFFCGLEILNNWKEYYSINQIPKYEVIMEEIKKIVNENRYNKNTCINLIHKELFIIHYIYNSEKSNPTIIKENSYKKLLSLEIKNNVGNMAEQNNNMKNNVNNKDINKNMGFNKILSMDISNKYEKDFIYLAFLEPLIKVLNSIKLLINLFEVKKTKFYDEINKYSSEINLNTNMITLIKIKEIIYFLKNLNLIGINIASFNENDNITILVDFLTIVYNNEEGIKFAFNKTNEEIRALSEFVGESENSKIQIRDIQDFMNVCNFFESIKAMNVNSDIRLIEEFKAAFISMNTFGTSFRNFLTNFKEIKNVYEEYLDKPEVSRQKIEQILKYSNINIYFDNISRLIQVIGSYTDISNNDKKFDNNDLQELHDRALLFSNKTFDNITTNVTEKLAKKQENSKTFVEIVENINILVSYLFSLYIKGYPNTLKVELIIENAKVFGKEKKYGIKDIIKTYKDLTIYLEDAQTEAYKEKPLIRLIYGQQFYDIYNYFIQFNSNIDIIPLLKKISDNKITIIPNKKRNNYIKDNNFKKMIDEINDFLMQCLYINNHLDIKDFYKNNIIKREFLGKIRPGFYSWSLDEMNYEIQIISIYKKLTGNLPLSITLLLCTKETNEEEITSFIYRAVLCSYHALFIIINSDNLELSNAQYFLWILETLYNKYKGNISSTLLILFSNSNSDLRKQLTLLKSHDYFMPDEIYNNEINDIKNDNEANPIKIWTSEVAGLGKSSKIKFEAEQLNLKYNYFPIGGSFTRKEIINRIIKLEIDKDNYEKNYLHIDIYDSDKETSILIREFLFSLLITRNYSFDEKIFYLGYGSKIVIEIPTGFYNMKDKFKLLNYFHIEELSFQNLPSLRDIDNLNKNRIEDNNEKKKLTDIQLVANILKMLENNEIEENEFDIEINHENIPLIECETIIKKYFTMEKGNYYQKMAFIHILADQFRKFCSSFYLKPEILISNQKSKILRLEDQENIRIKLGNLFDQGNLDEIFKNEEKITKVRRIMIENLIKLTLYFVKGPYNKIVLNQQNTNLQLFGEFNEKKINEIANQSLSNKDEIISFDKINPSLVFFNEDIQTFSIITTSKKGESEYNKLLKLYNSQLDLEYEKDSLID